MAEEWAAPDMSAVPVNCFVADPAWRFDNAYTKLAESIAEADDVQFFGRVEICLPLGCPFTLYLVTGWAPESDGCMIGTLIINHQLATEFAAQLRDAQIQEWKLDLMAGHRGEEVG